MRMYCCRILPLMWASTRCPFCSSTRNIALGSGSTTRPSTSVAPSFFALPYTASLTRCAPTPEPGAGARWLQNCWCRRSREGAPCRAATARRQDGASATGHCPLLFRPPPNGGGVTSGSAVVSAGDRNTVGREARGAAVLGGENPGALGGDGHRVLEVGGPGAVLGDHRPAVLELGGGRVADGHHRLDGQHQAGHELGTAAGPAVVEHVRVLVHLGADAVAAVVVDDAVRVRLGGDDLLDPVADVGQPAPGKGL